MHTAERWLLMTALVLLVSGCASEPPQDVVNPSNFEVYLPPHADKSTKALPLQRELISRSLVLSQRGEVVPASLSDCRAEIFWWLNAFTTPQELQNQHIDEFAGYHIKMVPTPQGPMAELVGNEQATVNADWHQVTAALSQIMNAKQILHIDLSDMPNAQIQSIQKQLEQTHPNLKVALIASSNQLELIEPNGQLTAIDKAKLHNANQRGKQHLTVKRELALACQLVNPEVGAPISSGQLSASASQREIIGLLPPDGDFISWQQQIELLRQGIYRTRTGQIKKLKSTLNVGKMTTECERIDKTHQDYNHCQAIDISTTFIPSNHRVTIGGRG